MVVLAAGWEVVMAGGRRWEGTGGWVVLGMLRVGRLLVGREEGAIGAG